MLLQGSARLCLVMHSFQSSEPASANASTHPRKNELLRRKCNANCRQGRLMTCAHVIGSVRSRLLAFEMCSCAPSMLQALGDKGAKPPECKQQ